MKALVVGTDYFADRFKYLLEKEGLYVRKAKRMPVDLDCDMAFFSGAACTPANIKRCLKGGLDVFSEQIVFEGGDTSFVDYARKHGLKLYLGSFDIFNPVIRQVSKLIEKEDVICVRLDRVGPVSHSNISIIEDSVLHGIGTLFHVLGSGAAPPKVQACFPRRAGRQCTLVLKIGNVDCLVYASNSNRYKERVIDVFCRSMRIRGDLLRQEIYILDADNSDPNLCEAGAWSFRRYYVKKEEPLRVLVRDFLRRDRNPVSYDFIKSVLRTASAVSDGSRASS